MKDIIGVSRARNAARDVTGALASIERYYVQLLEGPGYALDELISTIEADPRYTDVLVLQESTITQRSLPTWKMAYCGDSAYVARQIEAALVDPSPDTSMRVARLRSLLIRLATSDVVAA